MARHLKIYSEYFQAVIDGRKPMEIRYNDRNFKTGEEYFLDEIEVAREIPACPNRDNCEFYQYVYDEEEAALNCTYPRERCSSYQEHIYTGRSCLIRIKEVFLLDKVGLCGMVAFTLDILNIIDEKRERGNK